MYKKTLMTIICALVLISCNQNSIDYRNIKTNSGIVSGKLSTDGTVKIFMGIPFAAAPVGDLRWKAPQPAPTWDGVRQCVDNPPSAMQDSPRPFMMWSQEFITPAEPLSEDCLYLNVWTSATESDEKLPVIVWIHGGGFSSGSGAVPLYDGEELAKKGVVYVTVNYRLGALGFLAHSDLSTENEHRVSGNYGILDQIFALRWIKENIAAFGGDPHCVTIAGQSAGSMSVNSLMVSPLAKGLFHRAIGQSGAMLTPAMAPVKLSDAEKATAEMLGRAGLTINRLRDFPADSLLRLPARFMPVEDDYVLPNPLRTFEEGKQNDVPLITGWNKDDDSMFGTSSANSIFGENNKTWASLQNKTGKNAAYLYFFTHIPPSEEGGQSFGAFHSAEFGYALHTLHLWDKPFTQADYDLEETMSSVWVNFARTGNPGNDWKKYDDTDETIKIF